ncbi:hypothetical protein PYW08_012099 [Mythimna loreyi]|uniref:Uncharacterized protein n=1 Tax=Mythimna loreyi TaxID=667449 RepID=A0ACC2Q4A1_9NEOP|nr:hypothetical protein PYW08_012099 [Mythimna loreyi]
MHTQISNSLLSLSSEEECEESIFPTGVVRHRPEPPGTLAQSTRFTAHEIKLMYRGFKQECPSGVVDEETFKNIFCQFFPLGDATQYAHYVFKTIKHKQSGKVNFEEFLDILSRVARGSVQEKLSWVFTLYDVDGDGRISRSEMLAVVQAIYELLGRAAAPPVHSTAAKDHVDRIFHLMDTNCDGVVTPDELARWCSRDPALLNSLETMDTVLSDSARASCSTAADNCSPSPSGLPTTHSTTFAPPHQIDKDRTSIESYAPQLHPHKDRSMSESFASVETHVDRDRSIVESECESGIESGAASSSTSGVKSVVSSGVGKSEEEKVVVEKKEDKKKQPPPVPARVIACITEETVQRKVKRRPRRSSSPQLPR